MLLKRAIRMWAAPSLILIVALCGAAGAQTIAADNLTADYSISGNVYGVGYIPISGDRFVNFNETPAQEFTALTSGTITTVTATIDQFQTKPEGVLLNVSILHASTGFPDLLVSPTPYPTTSMGSASFAPSQVSFNGFNSLSTFDLSAQNIFLTAGESYFAEFWVTTPISNSARYRALLINSSPNSFGFRAIYTGNLGYTWYSTRFDITNEIGLTVRVNPAAPGVPEPGPIALVIGAAIPGGGFLLRRVCRRKN